MIAFSLFLLIMMCIVFYLDATTYTIPNWLNGALLIVYPLAVFMSPAAIDWKGAALGMGIVFVIGYVVFALKWMGGGDVKLITVCSLWMGLHNLPSFIFLFGVFGGVFSVLLLVLRKVLPTIPQVAGRLPRIFRDREPVPYGLAIGLAVLFMMMKGMIPVLGA